MAVPVIAATTPEETMIGTLIALYRKRVAIYGLLVLVACDCFGKASDW